MEHTQFLNINASFQTNNENTLISTKKFEKNKIFLQRMQKIAEDNEGILLSSEWITTNDKYVNRYMVNVK